MGLLKKDKDVLKTMRRGERESSVFTKIQPPEFSGMSPLALPLNQTHSSEALRSSIWSSFLSKV